MQEFCELFSDNGKREKPFPLVLCMLKILTINAIDV